MTTTSILPFFLLGLLFGSFLSVLIPRLKKQQAGIIFGRSFCPNCKNILHVFDLIPLLSYVVNRARCRYCKKPISSLYPIIEIITGLGFALVGYKFFLSNQINNWPITVLFLAYTLVLLIIFFYDYLYLEIPDQILLPAIFIALIVSFFSQSQLIPDSKNALLGAAIPVGFFLGQILISKGQWLGGGDLRIGAFMGLILGWKLVLLALFLSYLIGSIISLTLVVSGKLKVKAQVPFGPFLSVGTFITLLWGQEIVSWYLNSILNF